MADECWPVEWEQIAPDTWRAPVPSGWLVRIANVDEEGFIVNEALGRVIDPRREWLTSGNGDPRKRGGMRVALVRMAEYCENEALKLAGSQDRIAARGGDDCKLRLALLDGQVRTFMRIKAFARAAARDV